MTSFTKALTEHYRAKDSSLIPVFTNLYAIRDTLRGLFSSAAGRAFGAAQLFETIHLNLMC